MSIIFESPDGGKTIYARDPGSTERTLVIDECVRTIKEDILWDNIRQAASTNESLQAALEHVKIIYYMTLDNEHGSTQN